jgi:hypothetical protein
MKKALFHLINIILYFPLVILMFIHLVVRPDDMMDFYLYMESLTGFLDKKKTINKEVKKE